MTSEKNLLDRAPVRPPYKMEIASREVDTDQFTPSQAYGPWEKYTAYIPAGLTTLRALICRWRALTRGDNQAPGASIEWCYPGRDFAPSAGRATLEWVYEDPELPSMSFYPSTVTGDSLLRAHLIPAEYGPYWDGIDVEGWTFQASWSEVWYAVTSRHLSETGAVVLKLEERDADGELTMAEPFYATVTALRAWLMGETTRLMHTLLPAI